MPGYDKMDYEGAQATMLGLKWMSCQSEKHELSHMAYQLAAFSWLPSPFLTSGGGELPENWETQIALAKCTYHKSSEEGWVKPTALNIILTRHWIENPWLRSCKEALSSKTLILTLNRDLPALPSPPCFGG